MRRLIGVTLLPVLLAAGCAFGTRRVELAPGEYAPVNERSSRQEATLRLDDGTARHARHLRIESGTATWDDPEHGGVASVPVERIAQVRYRNRGRGALIGASWGYLICGAIGFVTGTADVDAGYGLSVALFAAPVCWLTGLPVGAAVGADDVFRLPAAPRSP